MNLKMDKLETLDIEKLDPKTWKVGTVSEFFGLNAEDESLIDLRIALSKELYAKIKAD